MDPETLAHVFEPFFTTKPVGAGTGLGLATVYGIVKQNRGFIEVRSAPGTGTTFRIFLPRVAGDVTAPAAGAAPSERPGGFETILLVEDEAVVSRTVRRVLEKYGYAVLSAATPDEARRLAAGHPGEIHLLLTDIIMPDMNGQELAVHLMAQRPLMKRLFMSGYTGTIIGAGSVFNEDREFLAKPFSREELAQKVREVLDRESAG
jgi:CheY-like chemotaxis protein